MKEEEVQSYRYQAPALPALVAAGHNYTFYWMVPFWICEFLIFWMKDQMLENGVEAGDWVVLVLWAITQIISNNLAIRSIKHPDCSIYSPIWFYILLAILSIFFTIYFLALCATVLFLEMIFCIITLIIQIVFFVGTIISLFIQGHPTQIKAM